MITQSTCIAWVVGDTKVTPDFKVLFVAMRRDMLIFHMISGWFQRLEANKTSKLQTELGTYHLQFDEINDVRELKGAA